VGGRLDCGPRLQTVLLGAFGALGLVLACIGGYEVISYSVSQREREMGIRQALGATRSPSALVLREGMALAVAGIAIGLSAARALTGFLSTMLYIVNQPIRWSSPRSARCCWRQPWPVPFSRRGAPRGWIGQWC